MAAKEEKSGYYSRIGYNATKKCYKVNTFKQ